MAGSTGTWKPVLLRGWLWGPVGIVPKTSGPMSLWVKLSVRLSLLLRSELARGWRPRPPHLSCMSFGQTEQVERNYIKEKKAAVKEFEDKKVELKENLIAELEEKKKMIENEKLTMELTGGTEPGPRTALVTPLMPGSGTW